MSARQCSQCHQWSADYEELPPRRSALLPILAEQVGALGALFTPHLHARVWCRSCLQQAEQAFGTWYDAKVSQAPGHREGEKT